MRELKKQGLTIIMVTHNSSFFALADQIIHLQPCNSSIPSHAFEDNS